jgi:uncharacterized protein YycO
MALSYRTIFLMIRGIDQTGRAVGNVKKGLEDVQKRQEMLARASYRMLFAGAAFMAFGAMATKALATTLELSTRGRRLLGDFGEAIERIKRAIGEKIVDRFGETLTGWIDSLDQLAKDQGKIDFIVNLALGLGPGLVTIGVGLTAASITLAILSKLTAMLVTAGLMTQAGAAAALAVAGTGATILLAMTLGGIISIQVQNIVWKLMPQKWKESWDQFWGSVQEQAEGDIGMVVGSGAGAMYFTKDGEPLTMKEAADIFSTVNIYIDNVSTQADVEELEDVISSAVIEGYEDTVGSETPGQQ